MLMVRLREPALPDPQSAGPNQGPTSPSESFCPPHSPGAPPSRSQPSCTCGSRPLISVTRSGLKFSFSTSFPALPGTVVETELSASGGAVGPDALGGSCVRPGSAVLMR